jgi:two-component system, cell cycle sensor histidine kinase and response regulator CckA
MKQTLLLVDDEPAIRGLIAMALKRQGYDVVEAADGEDALEVARDVKQLHAVVTDVCMPNLNGFAMAEQLQLLHPNVRFVFISGYPVDHHMIRPDAKFLCKPFLPSMLFTAIAEISNAA